jgi:hypothetical protein
MAQKSEEGRPYDLKQIYELMRRDAVDLLEDLLAGIRLLPLTAYIVIGFTATCAALNLILISRDFPELPLWRSLLNLGGVAAWTGFALWIAYRFICQYRFLTRKYRDLIQLARSEGLNV